MFRGTRWRLRVQCLVALACSGAWSLPGAAQDPTSEFAVTEAWLAAEHPPRRLLEDAVKELLAQLPKSFDWLAANRVAAGDQDPARRKGIETITTHCVLEFLRRQRESGVTYAGQYEVLGRLQPFVGDVLFGLLLDSPQWYPHTHRIHLVRPLRDLHRTSPGESRLSQVAAIVASPIEPEDLRRALACMLWQWGDKAPAQERIDALREASAEGDALDRVRTMLDLAELQYELLEYRASSATHRSVQALAGASGTPLKPVNYYSSACVHALSGDVERGIVALQKCASMLASPDVDASHKLARSLWENDPEIAVLRRDPRYPAIFSQAFGLGPLPAEATRR